MVIRQAMEPKKRTQQPDEENRAEIDALNGVAEWEAQQQAEAEAQAQQEAEAQAEWENQGGEGY